MARKAQTFAGLHFTFSNIFPTNQDPRMYVWASIFFSFGRLMTILWSFDTNFFDSDIANDE